MTRSVGTHEITLKSLLNREDGEGRESGEDSEGSEGRECGEGR